MVITKYNVVNPISNKKKPYYDFAKDYFIFPANTNYRYFVEASLFNKEKGYDEYYLLLSKEKFDENCRKCEVNQYGKCKMKLVGEIKEFVKKECLERGNVNLEYIESIDLYDVYSIR